MAASIRELELRAENAELKLANTEKTLRDERKQNLLLHKRLTRVEGDLKGAFLKPQPVSFEILIEDFQLVFQLTACRNGRLLGFERIELSNKGLHALVVSLTFIDASGQELKEQQETFPLPMWRYAAREIHSTEGEYISSISCTDPTGARVHISMDPDMHHRVRYSPAV